MPQRGSPISIGDVTTSRNGMLATTLVLPRAPAGDYGLIAVDRNGAAVGSPAAFTVRSAPHVSLEPTSGPPGTIVTVSVGDLQPGSLRIDYAGAAVVGPIVVDASSYTGSFVVPNDRPNPLGSTTSVVATNLVGDLMVGQGAAPFASQPGSATPQYKSPS